MSSTVKFRVRPGTPEDLPFLQLMLSEAAHWRTPSQASEQLSNLTDPHVRRYLDGWGREGDVAVIAEDDSDHRAIGAAWFRLFCPPETGYGFINEQTPELSIAVDRHARGCGVGTALISALAEAALARGNRAISLSVEKDNPAIRLYERCGYRMVGAVGNAWTMVTDLADSSAT